MLVLHLMIQWYLQTLQHPWHQPSSSWSTSFIRASRMDITDFFFFNLLKEHSSPSWKLQHDHQRPSSAPGWYQTVLQQGAFHLHACGTQQQLQSKDIWGLPREVTPKLLSGLPTSLHLQHNEWTTSLRPSVKSSLPLQLGVLLWNFHEFWQQQTQNTLQGMSVSILLIQSLPFSTDMTKGRPTVI